MIALLVNRESCLDFFGAHEPLGSCFIGCMRERLISHVLHVTLENG
ncbi:hypothetical protein [Paenibacillus validus]